MKKKICYFVGIIWGLLFLLMVFWFFIAGDGFQEIFSDGILLGLILCAIIILMGTTATLFIFVDDEPHVHIYSSPSGEKQELEKPDSNSYSKHTKAFTGVIFALCLIFAVCCYQIQTTAYDSGYKNGIAEAKSDKIFSGDDTAIQEAYNKGYEHAKSLYYNPDITSGSSSANLSLQNAPESFVWTTPEGAKYHTKNCRYVSDRTDLTVYTGSEGAENAGYQPCSVCNPY